jgi:hypothetical protein
MMKFSIIFGFKNGLDFQFTSWFRLKDQCALRYSTYKFFKRKKRKKESTHSSGKDERERRATLIFRQGKPDWE